MRHTKIQKFLYVYNYIHIHLAPTYQGFGAFLFICLLLYTQTFVFNDPILCCSCYYKYMKENKGMLQIIKRIENMKKQAQFYLFSMR